MVTCAAICAGRSAGREACTATVKLGTAIPLLGGTMERGRYPQAKNYMKNLLYVADQQEGVRLVHSFRAGLEIVASYIRTLQAPVVAAADRDRQDAVLKLLARLPVKTTCMMRYLCEDAARAIAIQYSRKKTPYKYLEDCDGTLFSISVAVPSGVFAECVDHGGCVRPLRPVSSSTPWELRIDSTPLWDEIVDCALGRRVGICVLEVSQVSPLRCQSSSADRKSADFAPYRRKVSSEAAGPPSSVR